MNTVLPKSISTVDEAKTFLTELVKNGESFHPEDDAHDIEWLSVPVENRPTPAECNQLNKLMEDIYDLPGNDGKHDDSILFCPCGFILKIQQENV